MTTEPTDNAPRIAISVERTVNLGNYESAKIFMSVSNLTAFSTDEDIANAIDFQGHVYEDLKERVIELADNARAEAQTRKQR